MHFSSLMDSCHLKNSELEPQFQLTGFPVVHRGDVVKDDSGSYAVFTEQGSSAPQMTAAKSHGRQIPTTRMRRTSSRRSISLYPGSNGRCSTLIEHSEIGRSGHLESSATTQRSKSRSSMEDPVVPLERKLYGLPSAGLLWEGQFEKIPVKNGWEKVSNWECLFVHCEKGLFLSVYVHDIKLGGNKTLIRCGR